MEGLGTLDMEKRTGQVNQVAGQNGSRVYRVGGQSGRGLSRVTSPVKFTHIFQTKFFFFFFEVDAICQLFMSSLTVIRFSLVILLPIITKHLT